MFYIKTCTCVVTYIYNNSNFYLACRSKAEVAGNIMPNSGDIQYILYMVHYLGECVLCNVLPTKVTQLPPGEECEMSSVFSERFIKLFYSF